MGWAREYALALHTHTSTGAAGNGFQNGRGEDWTVSRGIVVNGAAKPAANQSYTDEQEVCMEISRIEEALLESFRSLPPAAAIELSELARRLATRAPGTPIDWSDSWSDADLEEFTAAALRRLESDEQEEPR